MIKISYIMDQEPIKITVEVIVIKISPILMIKHLNTLSLKNKVTSKNQIS
jgi:hypothetical protein